MAKSKIHWYYGCCWGRACDLQCASGSFAKQAAENPDWYCVTCAKAARLALAKEQPIAVSFSSTVRRCARCRSGAINPSDHGRTEGADLDLCDVCYWRKRAESTDSDRYAELRQLVEDCQREAMDPASPLVVFDNALCLVLDWRHR